MGDEAHARVLRQHRDQLDGVVDRTVAEGAMLVGVDAVVEDLLQRLPLRLGVIAEERAEAATGGRRGAVDEDEHWFLYVVTVEARRLWFPVPGSKVPGSFPPVEETGWGPQPAWVRADQNLR